TLTEAHRRTVEASYDAELARLREQVEAQEVRRQDLITRRDALRQEYLALKNRITAKNGAVTDLARVRQRLDQLGTEQAVLAARREKAEHLQAQLDAEAFQPERQAERTQLQDQLDAEPFDEAHFEAVKTEAARLGDRSARLSDLEALAERRDTLARTIGQREGEQVRLRADLEQGTTLGPIRQKLEVLQHQLAAVGYDGARHEAVRRQLSALKEAPQAFMRLMEAQRNLTAWTRRREALVTERQGLAAEEAEHQEKLTVVEARLGDRVALEAKHAAKARARGEVEAELSTAQNRLGALKERLDRCAQDRAALKEARADHKEAKRESALYRHLRSAFGKHGIPSLIIEETLPEIEDRANELLERLSSGRTRVALETLKDKKTGGTKETLDIRITDEQGVARSYETFSGGEAFRVNFALRIALAQLLAERSGVRIRTLVVDEGFGTQDQAGIQNLVEAIRTIQDDFDKILVITHLDELKDAFPIRIEVTKRPVEGSTFEIVGV
ncbi:MAG: SMC family ATPase, partial [Rhodothermaceae bacterium]|nr:SMC family ATPase [Rhodothermaceae bacterium]